MHSVRMNLAATGVHCAGSSLYSHPPPPPCSSYCSIAAIREQVMCSGGLARARQRASPGAGRAADKYNRSAALQHRHALPAREPAAGYAPYGADP